ncbi:hypothetical protein ACQ4PT_066014 [Festuca glaucescens]
MASGIANAQPSSWLAAVAASAAARPAILRRAHAVLLTSGHLSSRTSVNSLLRASSIPTACALLLRFLLLHRLLPDHLSLSFSLHSCTRSPSLPIASLLHSFAVRLGHARDVYVVNAAVSAYFRAADVASAERLFSDTKNVIADVVTWTTMVTGHANAGDVERARWFFDAMPDKNVVSWNAMLGAYASAGKLSRARKLFDAMPARNAASWSSMVTGLVQADQCEEALRVFGEMVGQGVTPNESALVSTVTACGRLRSVEHGAWAHVCAERELRGAGMSVVLATAIVDMYGKCGSVRNAVRVFAAMPTKNIFSWNSMITGLAMNGGERQALSLFWKMQMAGVRPNDITFIGLLGACSHSGFVDEGRWLFSIMVNGFGIKPLQEHYGLMVDLLGRAGYVREAVDFVSSMPVKPHPGLWGALAGACRIHGEVELGEEIAKKLIELEPRHGSRYILLSNIYGASNRWDDMATVRRVLKERKVPKGTGNAVVGNDV